MRYLVSGSVSLVESLAARHPGRLGLIVTPSNRNGVRSLVRSGLPWAVDNGAFSGFDGVRFLRLLDRAAGRPRLLWVACPDLVGDARQTLDLFEQWAPEIELRGLPIALVGQDGAEDCELPWDRFACLFLGGSTAWKVSAAAATLALEAKRRGLAVHMGRVNSRRRIRRAKSLGCDTIDGSGASRFGEKYVHHYLRWMADSEQPGLF